MAKSGQKRKKAEKAKTQLKSSMKAAGKVDRKKKVKGQSGIRLPKGINETKVEVQTKTLSFIGRLAPLARSEELESAPNTAQSKGKKYRPIKVCF